MNGDGVDIENLQSSQGLKALPDQDHYEVLEIGRDADAEEIERAYALTCAAYSPEGLAVYSVYDDHDAAAIRDRVEEAFESFGKSIRLSAPNEDYQDVAAEAFLARGELLLRLGRMVEARADLADACSRISDPTRRRAIEAYLAA